MRSGPVRIPARGVAIGDRAAQRRVPGRVVADIAGGPGQRGHDAGVGGGQLRRRRVRGRAGQRDHAVPRLQQVQEDRRAGRLPRPGGLRFRPPGCRSPGAGRSARPGSAGHTRQRRCCGRPRGPRRGPGPVAAARRLAGRPRRSAAAAGPQASTGSGPRPEDQRPRRSTSSIGFICKPILRHWLWDRHRGPPSMVGYLPRADKDHVMRQFPASPITALIDSKPRYNLGESYGARAVRGRPARPRRPGRSWPR